MALSEVGNAVRQKLVTLNTEEALATVARLDKGLEHGEISEQQYIREANGHYASITESNPNAALGRVAARFAPRGVSIPKNLHAKLSSAVDRGERVGIVEKAIRDGQINPAEVLNA